MNDLKNQYKISTDKKPKNRNVFVLKQGIVFDSMFPSGNIAYAKSISLNPHKIQLKGNPDHSEDQFARYWLYFRMKGYRKNDKIMFVLKDANHLKKFCSNQKMSYKPKIIYKINEDWKTLQTQLYVEQLEDGTIEGNFEFCIKSSEFKQKIQQAQDINETKISFWSSQRQQLPQIFIASNYPYTQADLQHFLSLKRNFSNTIFQEFNNCKSQKQNNQICQEKQLNQISHIENYNLPYFNQEILTYSVERRKISLITITSMNNILSFDQKQPKIDQNIFPNSKDRPFKLKQKPIVFISGRVHPSQVGSSYFIQGYIDFLLHSNPIAQQLRKQFIFFIVPLLNPDGVNNGNYRHDNELRNLNRFYGLSNFETTPQIKAIQIIVNFYKKINQKHDFQTSNRLLFYFDIHGHQSAKSNFLFGNFKQKAEILLQNMLFCKLMQKNVGKNGFKIHESDFSKGNINIKEKYDQNSKFHSGRAFAGVQDNLDSKITFHAYTLQLVPFMQQNQRCDLIINKNQLRFISDLINGNDIRCYWKYLAQSLLLSINDIIQIFSQNQINNSLRLQSCKQLVQQYLKVKNFSLNIKLCQKIIKQAKLLSELITENPNKFIFQIYNIKSQSVKQSENSGKQIMNQRKQNLNKQIFKKNGSWKQSQNNFPRVTNKKIYSDIKLEASSLNKQDKGQLQNSFILIPYNQRKQLKKSKIIQNQRKAHWSSIKQLIVDQSKKFNSLELDQQPYKEEILEKIKASRLHKLNKVIIGDDNSLNFQGVQPCQNEAKQRQQRKTYKEQRSNMNSNIQYFKNTKIHSFKDHKISASEIKERNKIKMRIRTENNDNINQFESINADNCFNETLVQKFQHLKYKANNSKQKCSLHSIQELKNKKKYLQNFISQKKKELQGNKTQNNGVVRNQKHKQTIYQPRRKIQQLKKIVHIQKDEIKCEKRNSIKITVLQADGYLSNKNLPLIVINSKFKTQPEQESHSNKKKFASTNTDHFDMMNKLYSLNVVRSDSSMKSQQQRQISNQFCKKKYYNMKFAKQFLKQKRKGIVQVEKLMHKNTFLKSKYQQSIEEEQESQSLFSARKFVSQSIKTTKKKK